MKIEKIKEKESFSVKKILNPLRNYNSLRFIDLNNSNLQEIPSYIFELSNLNSLSANNNFITKFPTDLFEKLNLESLSLEKNNIINLPKKWGKLSETLLHLNISYNEIEYIDEKISELSKIKTLKINNNSFISINSSIGKMKTLIQLDIEWGKYCIPALDNELKMNNLNNFLSFCLQLKKDITFYDFINYFSERNIELTRKYTKKRTIIHIGALEEELGVLKSILSISKEHINDLDSDGYTPLFLSILEEKYKSTKLLLFYGANPALGGGLLGSCLHLSVVKKENFLSIDLINKGADINAIDHNGNTCFHLLFNSFDNNLQKSKKITKLLLENNANPQIENNEGWSAIHMMIKNEQKNGIKWLLNYNKHNKIDINKHGGEVLFTPLHLASHLCNPDLILPLIDYGADMFAYDKFGRKPKDFCKSEIFLVKWFRIKERLFIKENFKKILKKNEIVNIEKQKIFPRKKLLIIDTLDEDANVNVDEEESFGLKIIQNSMPKTKKNLESYKDNFFSKNNVQINNSIESLSDMEETHDLDREKSLRIFLKSPNHIGKIEKFQSFRTTLARRSCEGGFSIKNITQLQKDVNLKRFSLEKITSCLNRLNHEIEIGIKFSRKLNELNWKKNNYKDDAGIENIFFETFLLAIETQIKINLSVLNYKKELNLLKNIKKEVGFDLNPSLSFYEPKNTTILLELMIKILDSKLAIPFFNNIKFIINNENALKFKSDLQIIIKNTNSKMAYLEFSEFYLKKYVY